MEVEDGLSSEEPSSFDDFLAKVAHAPAAPVVTEHLPPALRSGTRIEDRYRIERLAGRGGMGEVYRAFDETLERPVAVKLARVELGTTTSQRWLREAEAMALLSHPNVVDVYLVATHEGHPLIVMEWIDGPTLAKWVRAEPRTWSEVLDVYRQAGRGLAAAHRAGLVHRDFKPNNVLLGSDGRARVADFGLVASLEQATPGSGPTFKSASRDSGDRLTRGAVGTPAYMAPEQAAGKEPDPRCDQYSFCRSLSEALWTTSDVPRWVRRVLGRGQQDDPARRFPDMDAVVRALDRKRRGQRRRTILGVGLTALGAAAAFATELDRGASCEEVARGIEARWNDATIDEIARAFEASGAPQATARAEALVPELDRLAQRWSELRRRVCEQARLDGADLEALARRRGCLERARLQLEGALDVFVSADRETVVHASDLLAVLPDLDACQDPVANADAALELQTEELVRRSRQAAGHANALRITGKAPLAFERANLAVELARRSDFAPAVAEALFARGMARAMPGGERDGLLDLQNAYWTAASAGQDDTAAAAARAVLLQIVRSPDDRELGERWSRLAEAAEQRSRGTDDTSWELLWVQATVHYLAEEFEAARASFQAGLVLHEAEGGDPRSRIVMLNNLSALELAEHRLEASARWSERALVLAREHLQEDSPSYAKALQNHALGLAGTGRSAEAIEPARRAVATWRRLYGPASAMLVASLNDLGSVLHNAGDPDAALRAHREAIAVAEARGHDRSEVADGRSGEGKVLFTLGRFEEAQTATLQAIAAFEEDRGADSLAVAFALTNLGSIQRELGALEESARSHERALEILEAKLSSVSPQVAGVLANRATTLLLLKRARPALADLERASHVLRASGLAESALMAMVESSRAEGLLLLGERDEAVAVSLRALELQRTVDPHPGPDLLFALSTTVDVLIGAVDTARAEELTLEALDLAEAIDMPHMRPKLLLDRAKIALAQSDRDSARRFVQNALDSTDDVEARAELEQWRASALGDD